MATVPMGATTYLHMLCRYYQPEAYARTAGYLITFWVDTHREEVPPEIAVSLRPQDAWVYVPALIRAIVIAMWRNWRAGNLQAASIPLPSKEETG